MGPAWLLDELDASGLRGRGGAAFPTALKWRTVAAAPGLHNVLANGEEGEPASIKDRVLMHSNPQLVIEGVALAAFAVAAKKAWVYVSDDKSASVLSDTVKEAADALEDLIVEVVRVPHSYVAGEETAAVRFINGGPALPVDKPPRPFQSGIGGLPTLVNNVETLAHAAWIAREGAGCFRSAGSDESPGTFLFCMSSPGWRTVVGEAPFGTPLSDLVRRAAMPTEPLGLLLGGYFSGFLPARLLYLTADDSTLREHGFGLGNGAFVVVQEECCPVTAVADLMEFFAQSSAQQCGACFRGTGAMRDVLRGIRSGRSTGEELDRLRRYGETLRGRGACQLLDAAALASSRALEHFQDILMTHLDSRCDKCARSIPDPQGGFELGPDSMDDYELV